MSDQQLKELVNALKSTDGEEGMGSGAGSSSQDLLIQEQALPPSIFILPLTTSTVFPTMMAPINVSNPRLIRTVEESLSGQKFLGLLLSRDSDSSPAKRSRKEIDSKKLYRVGVVVKILKRLKMPDGSINILVHSIKRFRVKRFLSARPHLVAVPDYLSDVSENSKEMDALHRSVVSDVKKLSEMNPFFTEEMKLAMLNAPGPGAVSDLVVFALSLPKDVSQEFLETLSVKERFEKILVHLRREQDVADIQKKIQEDVNDKISHLQRDYFLKEQLKVIKKELGMEENGTTQASKSFREQIQAKTMPDEVRRMAMKEVEKFEALSEQSPEHHVMRTYLETLCGLPWGERTPDNLDLDHAEAILEEDHYGLEKVKERIVEFLAVRKLISESKSLSKKDDPSNRYNNRGSIICLVGPPGVGKTSIGKSVARTLGRKFYRFSLGGMRDEAEIKGHRRTYVGAMPGKILQALKRAGTENPVIMLDEIDKLGQSFQGDPASALLEVLDPEQNSAFLDHYLDLPFDLSQVLFIATANSMTTIPAPLLDRMEVIEIPGYTLEEKEKIATRYVIPKVLRGHGLKTSQVKIERSALKSLMLDYAREPGLRSVQQLIEKIARKSAAEIVRGRKRSAPIRIQESSLKKWIGPKRFYNELAERIQCPGIVVGLAWTSTGGDILFIEASELPGSGQLKLTGQMGDVMSESATIAWSYVKKRLSKKLAFKNEDFKKRDLHVHIPAGAIPKDGPSAGVTMATALVSLFEGRTSRQKVAMTGELSLTGKVLPVGGIKEKILAAKRAGIKTVILPKLNQKDLADVPAYGLKGMKIHLVDRVEKVFDLVLEKK